MSIESVLIVTPEERDNVKRILGRCDEDMKEHIKILKEWLKKQPHLPYEEGDLNFKNVLYLNKFSLEKCKKKIDMFYAVRTLTPELFVHRNLLSDQMQLQLYNTIVTPLPKLTDDLSRVHMCRFENNNSDNFDITFAVNYLFAIGDFRYMYDECVSDTYIIDLGNSSVGHVVKHTPTFLKKGVTVIQKAYSDSIKNMHFINAPSYSAVAINIMNSLLSQKIANRVHCHKDYESLYKMVPKSILPKDYGGDEKPLAEIYANWKKVMENHNDWITDLGLKKSNENLRIGTPIEGDFFGSIDGSFRQLNID